MISYFRVDERVVHGQTTVHLSKQYPLDGILIVDDDIANDPFMLNIYKNVIPNDKVRVLGFTVEKAVTKLPEAEKSAKSYYVVCKRPTTVKRLMEAGYEIKNPVNLGPQGVRPGAVSFEVMLNLLPEEIEALDYAEAHGVKVISNPRLFTPNLTWKEASKGYKR